MKYKRFLFLLGGALLAAAPVNATNKEDDLASTSKVVSRPEETVATMHSLYNVVGQNDSSSIKQHLNTYVVQQRHQRDVPPLAPIGSCCCPSPYAHTIYYYCA